MAKKSKSVSRTTTLADMLFSQGFGTRRLCTGLVEHGLVQWNKETITDPFYELTDEDLQAGAPFTVQGVQWQYHAQAYLILHKPAGHECSNKPGFHPSIYSLLPAPLLERNVQALGRLDVDTTGLLLLSDDGQFIHRLTSPKHHVPKLYEVTTADVITPQQVQKLLAGVVLDDDPKPVRAAACVAVQERLLHLTLTEGKYHQVKRMLAAVGNHVNALHRSTFGALQLPPDLKPGQWAWLTPEQLVVAQTSTLAA